MDARGRGAKLRAFLVLWHLTPGAGHPTYSIGPPFFVCGTPSVIHFGAGVPFK
jgi:hypothetical protein